MPSWPRGTYSSLLRVLLVRRARAMAGPPSLLMEFSRRLGKDRGWAGNTKAGHRLPPQPLCPLLWGCNHPWHQHLHSLHRCLQRNKLQLFSARAVLGEGKPEV